MSDDSIAEGNRRSFDAAAGFYRDQIERSAAHRMVVVPAMLAQLGATGGQDDDVLCLGCGAGQELELLAARGPRSLTGIDISAELLELARARVPAAHLIRGDASEMRFGEACFDIVHASMTLQFVPRLDAVLQRIHASLRPGGDLVFTLPHPIYFGAEREDHPANGGQRRTLGYDVRRHGEGTDEITLFGDYLTERCITTRLQKELEARFFLRSVSTVVQALLRTGYEIVRFDEPQPRAVADDDDAATRRFITGLRAIPLVMAGTARRRVQA